MSHPVTAAHVDTLTGAVAEVREELGKADGKASTLLASLIGGAR
jgi:hypothetical protein